MYKKYIGAYGRPPHTAQNFLALASVAVNKLTSSYANIVNFVLILKFNNKNTCIKGGKSIFVQVMIHL